MGSSKLVATVLLTVVTGSTVTSCSNEATESSAAASKPSPSGSVSPLSRLPEVVLPSRTDRSVDRHLDNEEGSDSARVVAGAEGGNHTLAVYADGNRCGALMVRSGSSDYASGIVAERKGGSSSMESYPGGPYWLTSGTGPVGSDAWLEVSCSARAVVVTYSAPEGAGLSHVKGAAEAVKPSAGTPDEQLVVAPKQLRGQIGKRLREA